MTIGPEPRIRIFEMSVRLGIYTSCHYQSSAASGRLSVKFQSLRLDQRGDSVFILQNCLVNPGVPRLVLDYAVGAVAADYFTVSLNFQIAIDQVPVGAVFGVGAFGQANGSVRIHFL